MSLLAEILRAKQAEVAALRGAASPGPFAARTPLAVSPRLRRAPGGPLRLVTEVKFRSPSAGQLSRILGAGERARAYAHAGAAMISVLCDGAFFDGGYADLAAARGALSGPFETTPLLAKEFILDEVQLEAARAHGADAVLLIARIAPLPRLTELAQAARQRGLTPIVEVTDERELESALEVGADVIGVNARDLDTLAIDPSRAAGVLAAIPRELIALHFSGVRTEDDVRALTIGRADGALVGEVLMRDDDPTPRLSRLLGAARG